MNGIRATCVKPIVNTQSCRLLTCSTTSLAVSGCVWTMEFGPGKPSLLPPGHDGSVVGNEPVVVIHISGMANYAYPA